MFGNTRSLSARAAAGATVALASAVMLTGCGGSSSAGTSASAQNPTIQTSPVASGAATDTTSASTAASTATTTKTATATITTTATSGSGTGGATSTASSAGSHAPATPVTRANLPLASQIHLYDFRAVVAGTYEGQGEAGVSKCQTHEWMDLHANAEYNRVFKLPSEGTSARAAATIGSFATHAQAVSAAKTMADTLDCKKAVSGLSGLMHDSVEVTKATRTMPGGQTARLTYLTYALDDNSNARHEEQIGVVATGTHVALVTLEYMTQDYDTGSIITTLTNYLPTLAK